MEDTEEILTHKMERSGVYYRRKEHMKNLKVPSIGEAKNELGENISNVLFEQCPDPFKPEYGLVPTLDGAGDELWVSPSDLLIPKVCLKPPLTSKYIKALTHEGILEIGEDIDRRYWLQMEDEKARALEDQRELLMRIAEMERKVAIKLAREEERELAAAYIQNLMEQFEIRLAAELKNLEEQMLAMQDEAVRQAIQQCDEAWKAKLQEAVGDTIQKMTEQFAEDLERERGELREQFRVELHKQNVEFNYALQREQEFCEITLKQLRHCLECKNLANLMYVLCMERRKCSIEKSAMEYIYKNKISELEQQITDKDAEIKKLTEDRDRKQRKLDIREECLLELLKEFQKFINFALRCAPTQAEFLLSVEKMILYEVAKQTWTPEAKKPLKHLCKKIMSWKTDSKVTEPTLKPDLEPKDYHKCLEEVEPEKAELDESDDLAFFYYNDKMYVRKDMEYYFDHGIEISETNLLWSKDVQNLMQILTTMGQKAEEAKQAEDAGSGCEDKVKVEEVKSDQVKEELISVQDSGPSKPSESKRSLISFQQKKLSKEGVLKPVLKPLEEDVQTVENVSTGSPPYEIPIPANAGLLATQDSLSTIRMSRRSSFKGGPPDATKAIGTDTSSLQDSKRNTLTECGTVSFEHFQAIRILDEIELTRPSNRSSKTSLAKAKTTGVKSERESILQKSKLPTKSQSPSKLLHATDSLIIHRNSLTVGHKLFESRQQPLSSAHYSHGSLISKLSLTKDSLELIRKQSFLRRESRRSSAVEDTIILAKSVSKQSQPVEKYQTVQKVVSPLTVSHIAVAKIPTDIKEGEVKFSPIHEVYETNVLKTADSPWNIYRDESKEKVLAATQSTKEVLEDLPSTAEVMGDRKAKEYMESSYRFTDKRINSILRILRKDPMLIRLFTRVNN